MSEVKLTAGQLAAENPQYRRARAALLEAEIALRDQREKVAAMRRALPLDTPFDDYVLRDTQGKDVPVSGLFDRPDKPLILYHYMYGKAPKAPCPMCGLIVDSLVGSGRHIGQVMNFAILAAADSAQLSELSGERGWNGLRFLSCGESSIKRDLGFETASGGQLPGVTVVARTSKGELRHAYSACADLGKAGLRGMDLLMPIWHLLDLTPEGRGTWNPGLSYD